MELNRAYDDSLGKWLVPGKVLVLYGPRQSGKTTLVKKFLRSFNGKSLLATGEEADMAELLQSRSVRRLTDFFSGIDLFVLDEAQMIPDVGLGLKMLVDCLPSLRVMATGSSSFELANRVGEPLVGRKHTLLLYPMSVWELTRQFGFAAVEKRLDEHLVYGSYPAVYTAGNLTERQSVLQELAESYLFRDIIAFESIRNSDKIRQLLRLIAYQIGKEVSLTELGTQLGLSRQTVERYLDLLQKSFILFRRGGFSRNLRSEITKTCRYYFWDNGILNAVNNQFQPLAFRADAGALWENWAVAERSKRNAYAGRRPNSYFWRTYTQQEVDLIEEGDGRLDAFEFKWGSKKPRAPKLWSSTYPKSSYRVVSREDFRTFLAE